MTEHKKNTLPPPVIAERGLVLSGSIDDYPGGIVIPVDKPYRWTSADVIRKIKFAAIRHFRKKNLKVGHAGTLDPLATGVLLVCIGNATKLAESLQATDKEYIAGISFGATTPSYDLEKEIDRLFPSGHIDAANVEESLKSFIGEQDQVAPLFSAKSIDGVRAYELARKLFKENKFDEKAESIIRASRIIISELELVSFSRNGKTENREDGKYGKANREERKAGNGMPENDINGMSGNKASSRINVTDNSDMNLPRAVVRIACSKGTYIRAFARDLGEALDSGAHLDSLIRSRSGSFRVEDALSIDQATAIFTNLQH